jgi:predicted RNase H-like nuclease
VRFVGVDLAWGGRRPSGLAVLDAGGRVVAEGWATTDEELSGFLAGHDRGGAVVALDAPLVVVNPAGTRRGCEAELQRRHGRVGAGPYPTNLGLLGGRVRAMELVRRSDRPYVTVPRDPGRRSGWWAVEVFPAPALVELGGLARAVRYKRGRPRRAGRGSGRWRPSSAGWAGPTRRCGSTRRRPWPGSWAGWTGCGARG